jgi:hypothetical protein
MTVRTATTLDGNILAHGQELKCKNGHIFPFNLDEPYFADRNGYPICDDCWNNFVDERGMSGIPTSKYVPPAEVIVYEHHEPEYHIKIFDKRFELTVKTPSPKVVFYYPVQANFNWRGCNIYTFAEERCIGTIVMELRPDSLYVTSKEKITSIKGTIQ